MKKLILPFVAFLFSSALHAEVMFTLTNLNTSNVFVKNESSLLNKNDVQNIKSKIVTTLSKLGLKSTGRDGDTVMMKFESASIKGTDIVFIKLAIGSDVVTTRKDAIETFALSYEATDMIESEEDTKAEIFESIEFLLSEFSEHYLEDNE